MTCCMPCPEPLVVSIRSELLSLHCCQNQSQCVNENKIKQIHVSALLVGRIAWNSLDECWNYEHEFYPQHCDRLECVTSQSAIRRPVATPEWTSSKPSSPSKVKSSRPFPAGQQAKYRLRYRGLKGNYIAIPLKPQTTPIVSECFFECLAAVNRMKQFELKTEMFNIQRSNVR